MRLGLSLVFLAAAGALLTGCVSEQRHHQVEFELRKVSEERDAVGARLAQSEARSAELARQLKAAEDALSNSRAEVGSLSARVRDLEAREKEIAEFLKELTEQPPNSAMQRPDVAGTTLPPAADRALRELADRYTGRLTYDRGRGAISFANDRLFDAGSAEVRADAAEPFADLSRTIAMRELDGFEAIVVGHTDSSPITRSETLSRHPTNWHLSVHRAIAVKDLLVEAGVPTSRVGVMGYADQRPVGGDPALNRRIEVFLVPLGGVRPFEAVSPR